MKRWIYRFKSNTFQIENRDKPLKVNGDEVLVKPISVGFCGSDLFAIRYGGSNPPVGHEWVGEVIEIGSSVEDLSVGEYVTSSANYCCQKCESCISRNWSNCTERKLLGSGEVSVLSNRVKIHFSDIVKLPQDLSIKALTLLEVAFIGDLSFYKAKEAGLKKSDKIVIFGAGPIGIFSYLALKHRGYNATIVEVKRERIKRAKGLGIDIQNFAPFLISGKNFAKFDTAIDCTGNGDGGVGVLPKIHMFTKKEGLIVVVGKYYDAKIDNNSMHGRSLTATWLGSHKVEDFRKSVTFWAPIIERYSEKMVDTFKFGNINKAFEFAKKRVGLKAMLINDDR
ncbi:putative sorbitol/galactitol-1-phosphate 5-dehydrogenase [Halobacteriovorax marinus SJ]|uniref:Sorbitol/galactitol-1-phosphate 5-dehydrogenase n=1 Tax=Halobacteriovorax marinus (strain ATCC BAA-682 / DSM 15412 / SJ) TaxID=862908 RepID=E1WZH3_HALMS|nr:medium chain dehydrogenase/reductase family protein [Halobacteriovorax marinus]CBW27862.1 putative sorbitol/galactitol-1-phosphate 5-dehydrogenase [Halobacteriovorax marinus SJ]